jgi:hypothetical protein
MKTKYTINYFIGFVSEIHSKFSITLQKDPEWCRSKYFSPATECVRPYLSTDLEGWNVRRKHQGHSTVMASAVLLHA